MYTTEEPAGQAAVVVLVTEVRCWLCVCLSVCLSVRLVHVPYTKQSVSADEVLLCFLFTCDVEV